jgi:hypothetical protein
VRGEEERVSPLTGYAPYTARFVGGLLHGRTFEIQSLAPVRFALHSAGPDAVPDAQRDGQAIGGPADLYECDELETGDGSCIGYTFLRTVAR